MNTLYFMYPEAARHEMTRRLRAADEERRRRLAWHSYRSTRRAGADTMCR